MNRLQIINFPIIFRETQRFLEAKEWNFRMEYVKMIPNTVCPGRQIWGKIHKYAQNVPLRLVECSLDAKFDALSDKKRFFKNFSFFGVLGSNYPI